MISPALLLSNALVVYKFFGDLDFLIYSVPEPYAIPRPQQTYCQREGSSFFILYQSINIPFLIYLYRNPVRDKKPDNRNDKYNMESQKDILLYRKNQIDKKYKSRNNPC